MPVRDIVAAVFTEVAAEQQRKLAPLHDQATLIDLGLDSLSLAIIVARLEAKLGCDPFSSDDEVAVPETFGEFVALYDHVLA